MPDRDMRVMGIVSNCWKVQLDRGHTLESLIGEAVTRGLQAVELRQGFLGNFESIVAEVPSSARAHAQLVELAHRFPSIQFNLAVSIPCFGDGSPHDDSSFRSALNAATALARSSSVPHLRLVDTETRSRRLPESSIERAAALLSSLTLQMIDVGGQLSVEHAYQEWSIFESAIRQARLHLGQAASKLRICFDPCNLLLTEPEDSISSIVSTVSRDDVSMIHLKQSHSGQMQPDVSTGDLNWPLLIQALDHHDHRGPWLFEIAPHEFVWNNLHRSAQFLFGGIESSAWNDGCNPKV